MTGYMLDTNICIYLMNGRYPRLVDRVEQVDGRLFLSAIVVAELQFGMQKSARRERNLAALGQFLAYLQVLPFDAPAAAHFGEIRSYLESSGQPVGPFDMLIGAHARSRNHVLVTNNRREFDRMPGLLVEDWLEGV